MAELSERVRTTAHHLPLEHDRYLCQRCTACCRWPGEVVVHEEDIARIAATLKIDEQDFIERYTELRKNRRGLTLIMAEDGACIFLQEGACAIHAVKPEQCAGFPNQWRFAGWHKLCEAVLATSETK